MIPAQRNGAADRYAAGRDLERAAQLIRELPLIGLEPTEADYDRAHDARDLWDAATAAGSAVSRA